MKKTAFIICLAAFFISQWVAANPIGSAQALKNAQAFLQGKGISLKAKSMRRAPAANGTSEQAPYYVFNIGSDQGFVIASGDDKAYPVLAYSDNGSLRTDSLPDNVQYWLDSYEEQIMALKDSKTTAAKPRRLPAKVVEPMSTSKWNQYNPYNLSCPTTQSGVRCITGCVATAMAQVMYYHRKYSTRKVLEDIPGYIYNRDEEASVETVPQGTVIDWDNMLDRYLSQQYTDEQARAVANLMLYCGVSVQMQYGPDNSGTSSEGIVPAFVKYFGYNEYTVLKYRKDYDDEEWESMVYEELAKGNPLIYGGRTQKFTGHYFVLDGCDADGYVHVNWGWGGLDDGYFRLTSSDKMVLGGFSNYQEAIFDAVPDGAIQRLTTRNITLKSAATVEGLSSKATFPVSFTMTVANLNDSQNSFDLAVGLYKNGKLISMVDTLDCLYNFAVNNSKTVNASFNLDAKLAVGYYQLIPLSRKSGVENWHKNDNLDQFLAIGINNNKAEIFVGIPPVEGNIIEFADDDTKQICIKHWDKDGDGELTKWEAAAVTDLGTAFNHEINEDILEENPYYPKYFNELQYFIGLTSIGDNAFSSSDSLKSVILPPQLQSIGSGAFWGCRKLQTINIPESVTKIDDSAFESCSSLTTIAIPQGVTEIGSSTFYYCSSLVSVSLPKNLTKIGRSAFYQCSSLASIVIPQGVTAIGSEAFADCPLTSIQVEKGNTVYDSRENCDAIIRTADNTIILGCQNTVIPNSVTSIGEYAFKGCKGLTSIDIPDSVTEIGYGAFSRCTSLASIQLPSKLNAIEGYAFDYCRNLKTVEVKRAEPLPINNNTFSNYADATLYVPKGSLSAYMAADNWNLFGKIVELSGIKGDVNNDGEVTVADVSMLVDAILNFSKGIPFTPADINGDGMFSVVDVMGIVNHILNE